MDPTGEHPTCEHCGVAAPGATPPLTWSAGLEGDRRTWLCDRCAREHARSIEAKLDQDWW